MEIKKDAFRHLIYERMQQLVSSVSASIDALNELLPMLEGDEIDKDAICYETDEFRAVMKDASGGKHIALLLHPNGQTMHRRFYCWYFGVDRNVHDNGWLILTHRHPSLFARGCIMRPNDFTKSMALLKTMEDTK
jgi:hypothetical protein